ncbi:MAG: TetR family transcriptional regulator C-terminal domain-containing protein [Oleispira antarctica]|nr:TetR family transcriptional regulator C-terminal domain-containing protein [Oleispira antarctica]MBQ0790951.1 TetR family transcriptional regulator C-terminal domain-containing protein [Oleispira antarctica]
MNRPRRSEHTREALITAGIAQLSVHGYHGTGIKQILDEVNVPKGSFYNFFASKEAFVAEVIGHYSRDLLAQLAQFMKGEGKALTPIEQLRAIYLYSLKQYASHQFKKSCLVGSIATEISAESEMCRIELEAAMTQWLTFFSSIFEQAQHQKLVRDDISPSDMAAVYWAAWEGALIKMKMSADTKPVKKIMEMMIETLLQK